MQGSLGRTAQVVARCNLGYPPLSSRSSLLASLVYQRTLCPHANALIVPSTEPSAQILPLLVLVVTPVFFPSPTLRGAFLTTQAPSLWAMVSVSLSAELWPIAVYYPTPPSTNEVSWWQDLVCVFSFEHLLVT